MSVLDGCMLERLYVTLRSGSTFFGVLYAESSGAVAVLCNAEHIQGPDVRVPVDGQVVILRDDIDFMQRP